jgi:hypothetical protein
MARQVRVVRRGPNLKGENAMDQLVKSFPEGTAIAPVPSAQSTVMSLQHKP